ncbi:MAG: hypothetical protein ACPGGE_02015 [Poseidonia sp.]
MAGGYGFSSQFTANAGKANMSGIGAAIQRNIQTNGPKAIATMIAAPIAFKAARRVLGRPLINPANRILKQAGLSTVLKI